MSFHLKNKAAHPDFKLTDDAIRQHLSLRLGLKGGKQHDKENQSLDG
jgi:hypothetical protein